MPIVSITLSQLCDFWVDAHLRFEGPEPVVESKHNLAIWVVGHTSPIYRRYIPNGEASTKLYCLVAGTMCVNNLPKVVTRQCTGLELNWGPLGYKFGMLTLQHQATIH